MSDILSGGVIDGSTSGPIPSNLDDRKRDIIAEQKESQRRDAIGGTENPPTPSQPQQIPTPPQVAPPLPVIPSFDFNISASLAEETREVARQATIDVIKNVTINGQGPSIEGSTISFNIPQERPANEVFVFQGIAIPQSQFPQVAQPQIPQQPTIQLDRNQEIQSVTVSSPQVRQVTTALTQEPQVTIQETRGTQTEATLTTQEEAVRPEAQKISTTPKTVEPQGESIGERQDRENNERAARNREIRSALGLGEVSPFDEPPEIVPSETVPIGEKQDRENNERAKRDREIRSNLGLGNESPLDKYEGVSFGKRQDAELSERRERDKEIRRNLGLGEISPFDEETDVAKGFKAAEERSRQKRESDPNFDRESDVRQRGERYSDFRERQEALKQERAEKVEAIKEKAELSKRLKEGGIAETPSGMVPVALTRADGQKKILAYLASEFVGVVEGVESGERATSLPSEDSYYESGGSSCIGLALYTKNSQVWIGSGTVAGYLPLGFNPKEGKNIANGGQGEVWAEVNIDQITGEVVSTQVNGGSSTPSNTDTSFYIPLGYYIYNGNSATVTNYGCGSVLAVICRNWFSVEPPFYQVSLFR